MESPVHTTRRWIFEASLWGLLLWSLFYKLADKIAIGQDLYIWDHFWTLLSQGGYPLSMWFFPPSRYFFPDAIVGGVTHFLTFGNRFAALYLQFVVYAAGFVFLLSAILQKVHAYDWGRARRLSLIIAVFFSLVALVPDGLTMGLMGPQFRGGTQLMFLAGVLGAVWLKEGKCRWAVGVLLLLSFLGSFGDKLFILWFVIPFVVWLGVQKNFSLAFRIVLGLGVAGAALGGNWLGDFLAGNNALLYTPMGILSNVPAPKNAGWGAMGEDLKTLLRQSPVSLAMLSLWLWVPVVRWRMGDMKRIDVIWVAAGWLPLIAAGCAGVYFDLNSVRYFPMLFFVPVLWLGVGLGKFDFRIPSWVGWVGNTGVVVAAAVCVLSARVPLLEVVYPESARAVDYAKENLHLKDGLASYWYCKSVNHLSRRGAYLFPISAEAGLSPVMTNMAQLGVGDLPGPRHDYNYIFANTLYMDAILEKFGKPTKVFPVTVEGERNENYFFVYPDGVLNEKLKADPLYIRFAVPARP